MYVRGLSSARFKYKPGYRPCDLVKDFFENINFPPMRALEFRTGHVMIKSTK